MIICMQNEERRGRSSKRRRMEETSGERRLCWGWTVDWEESTSDVTAMHTEVTGPLDDENICERDESRRTHMRFKLRPTEFSSAIKRRAPTVIIRL